MRERGRERGRDGEEVRTRKLVTGKKNNIKGDMSIGMRGYVDEGKEKGKKKKKEGQGWERRQSA